MKKEKLVMALTTILLVPAVFFLLSPYYMSLFQPKKEITYSVLDGSSLGGFGMTDDSWPELQLLFNEEEIDDGRFVNVTFISSGTIPIERGDFDEPIRLHFSDEARLLGAQIIGSSPDSLAPTVSLADKIVEIQPLLLNPTDRFTIELLLAGEGRLEKVTSRIIGLERLSEYEYEDDTGIHIELVRDDPTSISSSHRSLIRVHPLWPILLSAVNAYLLFAFLIGRRGIGPTAARRLVVFLIPMLFVSMIVSLTFMAASLAMAIESKIAALFIAYSAMGVGFFFGYIDGKNILPAHIDAEN